MRTLWNYFHKDSDYSTSYANTSVSWSRVIFITYLLGAFISFGYITANHPSHENRYCSSRTVVTITYDGKAVPDKEENVDPECSEHQVDVPSTVFKGLFGALGWPLYVSYLLQKGS